MNILLQQRLSSIARRVALFLVLALLVSVAQLASSVFAGEAKDPEALERTQPADPGSQHASVVRNGAMSTRDGLTLRLTTDLGSVNIVQLEAGAAPVVRYTVHIETDARGSAAQQLSILTLSRQSRFPRGWKSPACFRRKRRAPLMPSSGCSLKLPCRAATASK